MKKIYTSILVALVTNIRYVRTKSELWPQLQSVKTCASDRVNLFTLLFSWHPIQQYRKYFWNAGLVEGSSRGQFRVIHVGFSVDEWFSRQVAEYNESYV